MDDLQQAEQVRADRETVLAALDNATPSKAAPAPEFESLMLNANQQIRLEAARIIAAEATSWTIGELVNHTLRLANAIETGRDAEEPTRPLRQDEPADHPS